jgi:hypothetical protein
LSTDKIEGVSSFDMVTILMGPTKVISVRAIPSFRNFAYNPEQYLDWSRSGKEAKPYAYTLPLSWCFSVDKKTGRVSFSIACECTPTRVGVAPLANPTVSVGHRIYESVNSAVIKNSGKNGKSSSKNAGDGAKLRIPRKAICSEDDSSVANDKDFYKYLCQRLTASLMDKKDIKRENKQVKQENERLKRENPVLNGKLWDISNMCAVRNGNN